ncbi:unnamed protein product [Orchesella dallaii]|uniref:Uncharacterized protein n=1 Tax=Orchesella dallaii TaxID=48710 RepID=A0ABP1S8D1_9HEXA
MGHSMRFPFLFPWLILLALILPICLGGDLCVCMKDCEAKAVRSISAGQRVYMRADMKSMKKLGNTNYCFTCRRRCLPDGNGVVKGWWGTGMRQPMRNRPMYQWRSSNLSPNYYLTGRSAT